MDKNHDLPEVMIKTTCCQLLDMAIVNDPIS